MQKTNSVFKAHVRAFAATNSSRVTKEELERELDKELEKAIPFILDKLDQSDEAHKGTQNAQQVCKVFFEKFIKQNCYKNANQFDKIVAFPDNRYSRRNNWPLHSTS